MDIIIIKNIKKKGDNNFNNFNNNKNYKKIKISKLNKYYGKKNLNLNFFNLLYSFGTIILLLKEKNKLSILLI